VRLLEEALDLVGPTLAARVLEVDDTGEEESGDEACLGLFSGAVEDVLSLASRQATAAAS
jgi:hypothetical protein